MKKYLLLTLIGLIPAFVQGQVIFLQEFDTPIPTSGTSYSGTPTTLDPNLSTQGWTTTANFAAYNGNTGKALCLNNSSGTPTITLTLNVAAGKEMNLTSMDFWTRRSSTGAENFTVSINGNAVASGTTGTTASFNGPFAMSTSAMGLTGTVTIEFALSGASGSGTYRIDDFTLVGQVTTIVGAPITDIQLYCEAKDNDVEIYWSHDQEIEPFSISRTDELGNTVDVLSDFTARSGSYLDQNLEVGSYVYAAYQHEDGSEPKTIKTYWVEVTPTTAVAVYPNPTTDRVTISGVEPGTHVSLYSSQGKLMRQWIIDRSNPTMDVSTLCPGTYLLRYNGHEIPLSKN